ncbi:SGNH hydrolase-type esterase domain-containing protein [Xylariaceae sp. FL1272]|nr:SGNH hydrolase-type esterase domain-containing protein [Xylariaceae sp. FL1272]
MVAPSNNNNNGNNRSRADPLRILCFGNSLTAGYPAGNPYADTLAKKIEKECPGRKVEFDVEGVPGDLVTTGHFIERMTSCWAAGQKPYDWTIVLGGTNDLGWGRTAVQIIEGLQRTWDIPLSRGGKVLSLTVPETKGNFRGVNERRDEVNDAIRSYEKTGFFHFDLSKAVPYHGMKPEDRSKYWEPDGVHLSAAGYDYMGEKIGEALVRILKLAEAVDDDIGGVAMNARQRKAIEELIFEEEMGDPKMLSQGYIVVRRKDLD